MVQDVLVGIRDGSDQAVDALVTAAQERTDTALHHATAGDMTVISGHDPMNQDGLLVGLGGHVYDAPDDPHGHVARTYRDHGDMFPRHLTGAFRLSVHDPDRGRLVLATDRTASKPLYYARPDGDLVFSSHLSIILAHPGIDPRLDRAAALDHLNNPFIEAKSGDRTLVEGVNRMHPGQVLRAASGGTATTTYWDVADAPPLDIPDDVAARRAVELLRETVRRADRCSDDPATVMFSGGFDSTLLTALALEETDGPVRTVTFGHVDAQFADARGMADRFPVDHREIRFPPVLLRPWEVWRSDAPVAPLFFFKYPQVRDAGITSCYSGILSNVAFPGNPSRLQQLDRLRRLRPLFRVMARLRMDRAIVPVLRRIDWKLVNGFDMLANPYRSGVATNWNTLQQSTYESMLQDDDRDDPRRLDRSIDRRWGLSDRPFQFTNTYLDLRERMAGIGRTFSTAVHQHRTLSYGPLMDFLWRLPIEQRRRSRLGHAVASRIDSIPDDITGANEEVFDPAFDQARERMEQREEERWRRVVDGFLDRDLLDRDAAEPVLLPDDRRDFTRQQRVFTLDGVYALELWIRTFIDREEPWRAPDR